MILPGASYSYLIVGEFVPQPENEGIVKVVPQRNVFYQHVEKAAILLVPRLRGWPALRVEPFPALGVSWKLSRFLLKFDRAVPAKTEQLNMSYRK